MARHVNARPASRLLGYVCPSCRLQQQREQRRAISTSFLQKQEEERGKWATRAADVRAGRLPSPLSVLDARGYVHQVTGDRDALDDLMTNKRIGAYCGVDPTAPSLHVGHMLPFMALFWMHVTGFHTVSLVGGATARIGDPTGRSKDRPDMSSTERKANIVALHYQMKKLWANLEVTAARHGHGYDTGWRRDLINNATWWNKTPFVDVLKYLGTGLRLGELLKRDTVKTKMESGDGMSFAEFCYPIMQAWDWWYLYDTKNVQMQIGGSDQFGNIVAGVDAVKHMAKSHPDPDVRQNDGVVPETMPYGLTVPLLTTASGDKFGKSAGNAVWLDESMTDLFGQYAYFVKTPDADVGRLLRLFTFLPMEKIETLMKEHQAKTSKQLAQKTLAYEFIHLVHGPEKADRAKAKYETMSRARRKTTLASLFSEAEPSVVTSEPEDSKVPSHFDTSGDMPEPVAENPLSNHQKPSERMRSTFVSQKLNPYAPNNDPNTNAATKHIVLPVSLVKGQSIGRVLHSAGLVSSRSEGHRLAQNQGAYIGRAASNRRQMTDELQFVPAKLQDPERTWRNVIRDHAGGAMDGPGEEGMLVLRTGKWRVRVVRLVSDDKFKTLGLPDPPGWVEQQAINVASKTLDVPNPGRAPGHSLSPDDPDVVEEGGDQAFPPAGAFVEPSERISRREAQAARYEQEKAALAYLDARAARDASSSPSSDSPDTDGVPSSSIPPNSRTFPWETTPRPSKTPSDEDADAGEPSLLDHLSPQARFRLRRDARARALAEWRGGSEHVKALQRAARRRGLERERERLAKDWMRSKTRGGGRDDEASASEQVGQSAEGAEAGR